MIIRNRGGRIAFNVVALNAVWLMTVVGATRGHDLLGLAAALVHLGLHCLLVSDRPRTDLLLCVASLVLGFAVDTLLTVSGAVSFPLDPMALWVWPLWMAALWINFSTSLRLTLAWLMPCPLLFALVGAVAGPVAYFAGAQIGALKVSLATPHLMMLFGLWGVAAWTLALLTRRTLQIPPERAA